MTESAITFLNSVGGAVPFVVKKDAAGNFISTTSLDGTLAAYRYAKLAFTPVATPTDFIVIQGSATMTVRVKRIALWGVATAQGNIPIQIIRRSSAGTLGSAILTAVVPALIDINDTAATAALSTVGTANYGTLGTQNPTGGVISIGYLNLPPASTGATGSALVWEFGNMVAKAAILRGTSDFMCINANGAALPSGTSVSFEIATEEDGS